VSAAWGPDHIAHREAVVRTLPLSLPRFTLILDAEWAQNLTHVEDHCEGHLMYLIVSKW
jgi:hypothetical protein